MDKLYTVNVVHGKKDIKNDKIVRQARASTCTHRNVSALSDSLSVRRISVNQHDGQTSQSHSSAICPTILLLIFCIFQRVNSSVLKICVLNGIS